MGTTIRISSKGQVVIPKDVRDALGLKPGGTLDLSLHGRRIVMEPADGAVERIDFAEFRRRVPARPAEPVPAATMGDAIGDLYRDWKV